MAVAQDTNQITFAGTKLRQQQAQRIFSIFRARGMFMSENAPIRIPLDTLTAFIQEQDGKKPADTVTILVNNPDVFLVETIESRHIEPAPEVDPTESGDDEETEVAPPVEVVTETVWVSTTRSGKVPTNVHLTNVHTFAERLMTPEPKIERPAEPIRVRPRVDPSWATFTIPEDMELEVDEGFGYREAPAPIEELVSAEPEVAEIARVEVPVQAQTPAELEPHVEPETPIEVETAVQPETPSEMESPTVITEEEPLAAVEPSARVEPEEVRQEAPVEVEDVVTEVIVAETPVPARVSANIVDLTGFSDETIAAAIRSELGSDARVAVFGSQWMAEDRVPRLSRGDLRRIKEYIEEQEQPLADSMLVQDILNVRPNSAEFAVLQFAINYRLSREHRDFEFVGTNDQRFWNTSSSPQLGTTRRKPNEIGTDYRFLVEQTSEVEPRSLSTIDHILTFYEFTLGLLPFDQDLRQLLPAQVNPDQKSAVLTFEFPQAYTTYLVELRYPTPNRGGFLLGLDDFYAENLVPGAMISITATENDGHYKVEYLPSGNQTARLLELDDRRSPRYLFRPTTFRCTVDEKWQISEDRFPRLGSEKPLDDRQRRRPETVVEATFERVGIQDGEGWITTFDDLLAATNIERPFSADSLRVVLDQHANITNDGSDTITYVSGS